MGTDVDPLKGLIEPSLSHFWIALCRPLVVAMNGVLDLRLGPRDSRVGIFGPFTDRGDDVILKVGQMVAELGYNAITGIGTFHKNNPHQLIALMDYVPTHAKKARLIIPDRVLFYELTRLVSKSIFFENDERGQSEELRGCYDYKVPSLGFIRHKQILKPKHCDLLIDKGTYTECGVTEPALCPHLSTNHFCPFYESIDIPWFSKEILLSKEYGNRLVAIRNLQSLKKVIRDFLS